MGGVVNIATQSDLELAGLDDRRTLEKLASSDMLEINLRRLAAFVYEQRTQDNTGAAHMLAVVAPGFHCDRSASELGVLHQSVLSVGACQITSLPSSLPYCLEGYVVCEITALRGADGVRTITRVARVDGCGLILVILCWAVIFKQR